MVAPAEPKAKAKAKVAAEDEEAAAPPGKIILTLKIQFNSIFWQPKKKLIQTWSKQLAVLLEEFKEL